jgi:3-oxoacyl-[acyl-carrier protein] reductase
MELRGKTAFVTGGSGDIGSAIARELAAAGADVAISYVGHSDGAAAAVEAVQTVGRRGLAVQLDQRNAGAIDAAVGSVLRQFGRLDILVNNAAWNVGIPFSALDDLTADLWDRVLETNLRGPYLLARAFAPHLRAHHAGRIVNIASVRSSPGGSSIAYAAGKAALSSTFTCCPPSPWLHDGQLHRAGLVEGTRTWRNDFRKTWHSGPGTSRCSAERQAPKDIADQAVAYCRAESVTGQVLVTTECMPGGHALTMAHVAWRKSIASPR